MLKELQDIGLSEKEAKVYLAALELGPATADQLAKHAKIVRSTTYVQLESLMKIGLMSTYEEGKKTFFAPESPELLKRLLSRQKQEIANREKDLASFLPDLIRQFEGAGERPIVRFFPGKEGITAVREEMLKSKEKKIYTLFSYEHLRNIYSEQELDDYSDRRKSLDIYSRAIYMHKEYFSIAGIDNLTERRFIRPEFLALDIHINITDNKTAIYPMQGGLFGTIIESEQITKGIRSIFDFLWLNSELPQ